jgi:DNA-binding NarL/FixJ family response regulator
VGTPLIRVAVVDDHPVFREGLAHTVENADDLELVRAVGSVEELLGCAAVEVVILDLGLPGISGAAAVTQVRTTGAIVLVVSADAEQRQVIDAVGAGASGYLTKSAAPAEIVDAVRIVAGHGTYVSPTLASFLIQAAREPSFTLTPREREILALVAAGERDVDIAEELFISIRTVRTHIDRIRDKTGRRRRADLTRLALEEGVAPHRPDGAD